MNVLSMHEKFPSNAPTRVGPTMRFENMINKVIHTILSTLIEFINHMSNHNESHF